MLRYFWRSDDEQLAGQWVDSHMAEDADWWIGVQQAGATIALATVLTLTATSTTLATSVFSQSQDDPAGNLTNVVVPQEDYWQNQTPPVVWPQPSVFTDDDAHVQFVQTFTPDDGDWTPLVPPVQATNYVRLPFLDPEDIPQLPTTVPVVDEQEPWAPQVPPADPEINILVFLDDGSWVPAMEPDEDFLPSSALPAPQNWAQPLQAFFDTDDIVPEFVAEDVVWLQLVPPVPATLQWPQPFIFEQNESTNLVAFTTEEYALPLVQPVPASIWLLRQDAFEQTDATGSLTLTLDDSFQPLVIPGVPFPDQGALRLLQPWQFEQNEPAGSLRNNLDEDYLPASALPAPVVWPQVNPFVFDELIVPQSAATIDEIYFSWLVAPVPAALSGLYGNALYLPEPEEIPAGSLLPPLPPPSCPLPPVGPDGDISMSVFGGAGRPTLALFCRICKSGKPLVVRADYAIWCQDCCAFVSKQDTYMGTVQAPGAFKNIF